MKRIILIFLLCIALTGCDDDYDEPQIQTETAESTEQTMSETWGISDEVTETCSERIFPETAETEKLPEIAEIQETITVSEEIPSTEIEGEEEQEPEIAEISEEIIPEPTKIIATEELTEIELLTEFMMETETVPEIVESTEILQTEPIFETEPMPKPETIKELETISELSDYEKAQIVYEYMLENGHGTCVNYACQTYEKCLEIGISCYIVWTDAGIYGHTANTVCVNEIWFIMDTQAGGFLREGWRTMIKKLLLSLFMDEKTRKRILLMIGSILVVLGCMMMFPFMILAQLNQTEPPEIQFDESEFLLSIDTEKLTEMESECETIADILIDKGLQNQILKAQLIYISCSDGNIKNLNEYADIFHISDDKFLINTINSYYGFEISQEEFQRTYLFVKNATIDPYLFENAETKNSTDLVAWCRNAYESR